MYVRVKYRDEGCSDFAQGDGLSMRDIIENLLAAASHLSVFCIERYAIFALQSINRDLDRIYGNCDDGRRTECDRNMCD